MSALISFLKEWNVFVENDRTDHQHRSNLYATRIYLFLLFSILISLTLGLGLIQTTSKIIIDNPTLERYEQLTADAQCPCSQLAIPYGTFIRLGVNLHGICASDFVADRWIELISSMHNVSYYGYRADFRVAGSAQFLALAAFCRLSAQITGDSLANFASTSLISPQAIARDVLQSIVQSSIKQFQESMPTVFQTQLRFTNLIIFGNNLISGLQTTVGSIANYYPTGDNRFLSLLLSYTRAHHTDCYCYNTYHCGSVSILLKPNLPLWYLPMMPPPNDIDMQIPGWYTGCLPIHALLLSSLECFYDQACVDRLTFYLGSNQNFTAIQLQSQSVFQLNTTIQSILDRIMIEYWQSSFSFRDYFNQCQPALCYYTVVERYQVIHVLTIIIGILGTLRLVLRLIIPKIVHYARDKRLANQMPTEKVPMTQWLRRFVQRLRKALVELNLFKTESYDTQIHRYQVVVTRFYIIIVITSFLTLSLYQSLGEGTHQETSRQPTLSKYLELEGRGADSLLCSCNNISISRRQFLQLTPIYHDICSSFYVSSTWIDYLQDMSRFQILTTYRYRVNLAPSFRLLQSLCEHAQETVTDTLTLFLDSSFVSSQVMEQKIFLSEIQALIDDWKFSTINRFKMETQVIQAIQQGNKYLNEFQNFYYHLNQSTGEINFIPMEYENCSCALSQWCHIPTPIGRDQGVYRFEYQVNFTIENFYIGCSIFESLMQSTLACFYNQTCVSDIRMHLTSTSLYTTPVPLPDPIAMTPTDQWPNTTLERIESIVNRLMVNQWQSNISFAAYYQACAPESCVLEYRTRRGIFLIFAAVFSALGGLSTSLKVLILIFIRVIEKLHAFDGYAIFRTLFHCQSRERVMKRIRFLSFLALICLFYLIYAIPSRRITVTIMQPSLSNYEELLEVHSKLLQCSCSKIAFNYQSFLSIHARTHAICSSPFVSTDWILFNYEKNGPFLQHDRMDYRRTIISQYQLLSSFCELSQGRIQDAILQLNTTTFIGALLLSPDELHRRVQTTIDNFKSNAPRTFLAIFNMIREVTETNMLTSLYSTNWRVVDVLSPEWSYVFHEPVLYGSCSCGTSTKCTQASESFRVGCYPLEALLQSTLRCFYDQQCIDPTGVFSALNYSSQTARYDINTTVESILNELMIEEYAFNISYQDYFHQCAASSCSYSYQGRQETVDTITSIIGLYGGLAVISRWMAAILMAIFARRHSNIGPIMQ